MIHIYVVLVVLVLIFMFSSIYARVSSGSIGVLLETLKILTGVVLVTCLILIFLYDRA